MKFGRYALNVIGAVAIGLLFTRWFMQLPIETPIAWWIESAMDMLGMDVIAHADDVEPIGFFLFLFASIAGGGVVMWAINWLVIRLVRRQ
ncbi:hypothetical protein [Burkholderia gladioli]|uniref:hypothetical protein n=1 Tax=Burkholderia gladioli TaxID=28095 RepID=UPI00164013A9|nr:hypothetical protein [Burkholderia gladioli]MBU9186012.1 hypothetical protein [Burkholderia gladioli]